MQDYERLQTHVDHAYSGVVASYTVAFGIELDAYIEARLRSIHSRASTQAATADAYHRSGMDNEVLLAGETKGRIEALRDLGFVSLEGVRLTEGS